MAFPFLLLGAQAAGIGLNLFAQSRAEKFTQYAEDIQQQQLQLRMEEEQVASSQQSLFNVQQLRSVMATQRAIFGARGQMPGVGSAGAITATTEGMFHADERARQLSLGFKQNQLKSQMSLYGIKRQARAFQSGGDIMESASNMFNFNALGENPFGKRVWKNPNNRNYGQA